MFNKVKWAKRVFFIFLIFLFFIFLFSRGHVYKKEELEYGITFSKKQVESLNLDWQEVYLTILDELKVKKLRLPAYWNEIEPVNNQYVWQDLDWQIEQAEERGVEIILAVGGRLPRWPECHFPDWTNNEAKKDKKTNILNRFFIDWSEELAKQARQAKILNYIEKVILRYKDNRQIVAWQVENEPF